MTNSYNATNTTGWNGYVFSEEFQGLGANSAISSLALEIANGNTNRTYVLDKETTHGVGFSGIVQVQQFTVPQYSVINHVDLKVFTAAGNVIVKVYADSGGSPSTLIGESGSIAVSGTGVQQFALSANVTSTSTIWAGFETDNGTLDLYHDSSVEKYTVHTYGPGPTTFGSTTNCSCATYLGIGYTVTPTHVRVKIYQDDSANGGPSTLLGESGSNLVSGHGIQTISVSATVPSSGNVWAAFETDANVLSLYKNSTNSNDVLHTYGPGPSPFGTQTLIASIPWMRITYSPPTPPGPPTSLTATATSSTQINLSWIAPSNNGGYPINGYKIERSTNGGSSWSTLVANTTNTATTYSDTGLSSGKTYTYRVSAINHVGTSSPSNTALATTDVTSTDTRLESSGEQRVSYFNGTVNYEFYYNGTSANIFYRYSVDGGNTWSAPASTGSGALLSNSYFGVYGTGNKVILTYTNSSSVLTKTGTILGTSIAWPSSPKIVFKPLKMTGSGTNYYPSFDKVNSTTFLGFNVLNNTRNVQKVFKSTNNGTSWSIVGTFSLNDLYPTPLLVAKYGNTKLVMLTAKANSTEFGYKTYDGSTLSAGNNTIGAGLTNNTLKTQAVSVTSNGTCAWIGYVPSNNGGTLKSMKFCGSPQFISTSLVTTNFQPTISSIGGDVHLFYTRSNNIFRIININGTWYSENSPFSTSSASFLHVEKYGYRGHHIPVIWREGISSPFTIKFGITDLQPESANGYFFSYPDTNQEKQDESTVAISTSNPSVLVGGYNNVNTTMVACKITRSQNEGLTWNIVGDVKLTTGSNEESDPVAAVDKTGKFYFACMSYYQDPNTQLIQNSDIIVYNSTNNGQSFVPNAQKVHDYGRLQDKPWLGIDLGTNMTSQNNVYLSWDNVTSLAPFSANLSFKKVAPTNSPTQVLGTGIIEGSNIAIGPQGQVFVSWYNLTSASSITGEIDLVRNYNAGSGTFTHPIKVGSFIKFPPCVNSTGPDCITGFGSNEIRINYSPSMVVDPSGVLHIVYDTYDPQTKGDIYYVTSNNCNNSTAKAPCTFRGPMKINSDYTSADQFEPVLTISTKTNPPTLHVTVNDRRDDPNNVFWKPWDYHCHLLNSTYCTNSINWDNIKLNEQASTNLSGTPFMGDYHGIFSSILRELYSAWTDSRSIPNMNPNNYDIYGDKSRT